MIALMEFLVKIVFHGKHFPDFFRFKMFHVKHKTQKIFPDADIWNRDLVTAVILSDYNIVKTNIKQVQASITLFLPLHHLYLSRIEQGI